MSIDLKIMDVNVASPGGGGGGGGGGVGVGASGFFDFYSRFQALQLQRDTSDELIKDLLLYSQRTESGLRQENERLREQLRDSQLDLVDATRSRRDLQQRVVELEHQFGQMVTSTEHLKNQNPYIIVLIDGDGCHFQQKFIEKGVEGGKQAAYALRTAILQECHEYNGEIEVIVKYIANLQGLAYITRASGTVANEVTVKAFTLGFTQGLASFDFVDVGQGKERADTKIKEAIRWHIRNHNCRQIVLGGSFDSGYAPFLDDVLRDDDSRKLVTIMEGPPTHRDLIRKNLNILNLTDTLFRSDKLEVAAARRLSDTAPLITPVTITPPATVAGMSPLPPPPTALVNNTPSNANGGGTPLSSYATAIKVATPPPQITLPIPLKQATKPAPRREKQPAWNPGVRGVDPPLEVNQNALDNIKKRKDNNKLCNNHYLRGPCAKGDSCCFEHRYKPSEAEKTAISFLARLNPCTSGQDCEVEDCIYGHHCPSTREGQCTHPYCKFRPWEHPPNTKFRHTYQWVDED